MPYTGTSIAMSESPGRSEPAIPDPDPATQPDAEGRTLLVKRLGAVSLAELARGLDARKKAACGGAKPAAKQRT